MGVAAFSLLGLAIVLGVVALAGLRPWATTSVAPDLSVSPGIGAGLGDSAAVARAPSSGVGTGGIAAPRSTAASTAAVSAPAPVAVSTPGQRPSRPVLAVSAGRALRTPAPTPVSAPPAAAPAPSPEPVAATPAPAPVQVSAPPLVATVENGPPGTPGRPGTSVIGGGEPEQSCEAGEYVITVTFEEVEGQEVDYEMDEADILVKGQGADGSETEVQLRGDLSDVRGLIATLIAEGNCVHLEAGTAAEDGTPSGGTSPVVVPTEGLPSSAPDLVSGDQAAPSSP